MELVLLPTWMVSGIGIQQVHPMQITMHQILKELSGENGEDFNIHWKRQQWKLLDRNFTTKPAPKNGSPL